MFPSPSREGRRSLPTLLPNPCPPPSTMVEALTVVLIQEHDGACSTVARLEFELAMDWEAKRTMEARAEVSWQKVVEIEEAH